MSMQIDRDDKVIFVAITNWLAWVVVAVLAVEAIAVLGVAVLFYIQMRKGAGL